MLKRTLIIAGLTVYSLSCCVYADESEQLNDHTKELFFTVRSQVENSDDVVRGKALVREDTPTLTLDENQDENEIVCGERTRTETEIVCGERSVGDQGIVSGERSRVENEIVCGERTRTETEIVCGERTRTETEIVCGERTRTETEIVCGERTRTETEIVCGERTRTDTEIVCGERSVGDQGIVSGERNVDLYLAKTCAEGKCPSEMIERLREQKRRERGEVIEKESAFENLEIPEDSNKSYTV